MRFMKSLSLHSLKIVRWTGWLLLLVTLTFLLTGYLMSGRFHMALMDENHALTWHKLMHLPLIVLLTAHTVPAVYLAMQRWGWIKS